MSLIPSSPSPTTPPNKVPSTVPTHVGASAEEDPSSKKKAKPNAKNKPPEPSPKKAPQLQKRKSAALSDKLWKSVDDFSKDHQANLTQTSVADFEGVLGLTATLGLGSNLSGQVPDIPGGAAAIFPFLSHAEDLSHYAEKLEETQKLQHNQMGADGKTETLKESDYLQLQKSKLSLALHQGQSDADQVQGSLDFKQRALKTQVKGQQGESYGGGYDFDDRALAANFDAGPKGMATSARVGLRQQNAALNLSSVDDQQFSLSGDLNDRKLGLGYSSAPLTQDQSQFKGNTALSIQDGLQLDTGLSETSWLEQPGRKETDQGHLYLGRRLGFSLEQKDFDANGKDAYQTGAASGWRSAASYDTRSGRTEISGGSIERLQAGVATGGGQGTTVKLSLGEHIMGSDLKSASAKFSLKKGEVGTELGLKDHKFGVKINGTGVSADLTLPLGPKEKIGGGLSLSRARDVLSQSLGQSVSGEPVRTLKVANTGKWSAHASYTHPSKLTGKVELERTKVQDYAYTAPANELEALPELSALEKSCDQLEKEQKSLENAVKHEKKALDQLKSERHKVQEREGKYRDITKASRQEQLAWLERQIDQQAKKYAAVQQPEQVQACRARLAEIATDLAEQRTQLETLQTQRLEQAQQISARVEALLETEGQQGLDAALKLPAGTGFALHRQRELGTGLETGVDKVATTELKQKRTVTLDLRAESLGEGRLAVEISRKVERERSLDADGSGLAEWRQEGEKDQSRAYRVEVDLKTETGQAFYAQLLESVQHLGHPLPEPEPNETSLCSDTHAKRRAKEQYRHLNLSGQAQFSLQREGDFSQELELQGGGFNYLGSASRSELQDSKKLPVVGQLFAKESRVTSGAYALNSEEGEDGAAGPSASDPAAIDPALSLSLKLSDARTKPREFRRYTQLYQQSQTRPNQQPEQQLQLPERALLRQDKSAVQLELELQLSEDQIQTLAQTPRETLLAAARETPGIGAVAARKLERHLQQQEKRAQSEATELGLTGPALTSHLQVARMRALLDFVAHQGEPALPFLQSLTGHTLQVSQSQYERGAYQADQAITDSRLQQINQELNKLGSDPLKADKHHDRKQARHLLQELEQAETSLQIALKALAADPNLSERQKQERQQALQSRLEAVQTLRQPLTP